MLVRVIGVIGGVSLFVSQPIKNPQFVCLSPMDDMSDCEIACYDEQTF